jgi:hypothetical protein
MLGAKAERATANHQERRAMAWNIYRRDTGVVIVRDENEEINGCFNFVREATESEIDDEQKRRETKKGQIVSECNQ